EARRILSYPGTIATHSLLCLLSIFGTAATSYVSWLVARHKVFHVNLRWLLTTLNLLLLTRSLMAFMRSAFYLFMLNYDDDCSLLWRTSRCTHFSEIVSKAVMVMSYAYLAIAIERLLALWLSKRYEQSNKQVLGVIGFVVVWFEYAIDFGRNIYSLSTDDGSASPYSVYCMSTSSVDMLVSFRLVPISLLSLSLFIGICFYVKIRNRAWMRECSHNLTARFQERITYKATRLILPNAIIFCCMYLMQLMAAVFSSIVAYKNNDKLGSVMIKELASLIFNSYSIIHPVIFLYIEPALWKEEEQVKKEDRTTYNRALAHTWEKTLKKRERRGLCCWSRSRREHYQRTQISIHSPSPTTVM
ncbi:hypothetical protein PRIPAC_91040, partial [Pristionchus pacificus]